MGVANWAAAFIMAMFVFIGASFLFTHIITGASAGEVVVRAVVPVLLAGATLAVVINVFRG